jgi:hypothetical protein
MSVKILVHGEAGWQLALRYVANGSFSENDASDYEQGKDRQEGSLHFPFISTDSPISADYL